MKVARLTGVGLLLGMLAASLTLSASLVACGGSSTGSTTPTNGTSKDEEAMNAELREHHAHHHGGFMHLVVMSAETIGGTPEQKEKIDAVRKDLLAKTAPVHDANKNVLTVLGDVLGDGIATPEETAKLDAAVVQLAAAAQTAHTASASALNQLHSILDAPQRATLVEKVEAHWHMWRQANAAEDKDNNGLAEAEERRLEHMTKMLSLSSDQVEKMKTALKTGMANLPHRLDHAEVDAHVKAFGEAFTKDTFDAASLKGEDVASHLAGAGAGRMVRFYATIAPILTPEQRTKLADHFHKHQNKGPETPSNN